MARKDNGGRDNLNREGPRGSGIDGDVESWTMGVYFHVTNYVEVEDGEMECGETLRPLSGVSLLQTTRFPPQGLSPPSSHDMHPRQLRSAIEIQ